MNARNLRGVGLPKHMAGLPRDARGYPVPWFCAWVDGKPDFRIADAAKVRLAVVGSRCWICGGTLGRYRSFLIGPMGAMNRVNSEPPSHHECAQYAIRTCPFLALPKAHRRSANMPEESYDPDGLDPANVAVVIEWVSSTARVFKGQRSLLFELGEPDSVQWFTEGRPATRDEAQHAIEGAAAKLLAMAGGNAVAQEAVRIRMRTVQSYLPELDT
ncbi:hypothetical protein ACGYQ5_14415 [Burkholderia pseudomallei]